MRDIQTLKKRLFEAEDALHRLLTGALEVTVSIGGFGATTYAKTEVNKLRQYITELKFEISEMEGSKKPRGPIFMRF